MAKIDVTMDGDAARLRVKASKDGGSIRCRLSMAGDEAIYYPEPAGGEPLVTLRFQMGLESAQWLRDVLDRMLSNARRGAPSGPPELPADEPARRKCGCTMVDGELVPCEEHAAAIDAAALRKSGAEDWTDQEFGSRRRGPRLARS